MDILSNFYILSLLFYVIAMLMPIIFYRKAKYSNVFSNIFCIIASFLGLVFSVQNLLGNPQINSFYNPLGNMYFFSSGFPFVEMIFTVNFDPISLFFSMIFSLLVFCVSIYSIGYNQKYYGKKYFSVINLLFIMFVFSMYLLIFSNNMLMFFILWEIMTFLSFFLIIFENSKNENKKAGLVYIIMGHIGALFLLLGIMLVYRFTNSFSFNVSYNDIPENFKNIIFIMFLLAFGTKAGIVPLHIWLPETYKAAPSNVTALMSGIMVKFSILGFVRFILIPFMQYNPWWGVVVIIAGCVTAFVGAALAVNENNIKKLIGFSSMENMGIIFLGIGISMFAKTNGKEVISALALLAVFLHVANHAIFKCLLFLSAGSIKRSTSSANLEDLGGLMKKMPYTGVLALVGALSISAIVPFNGFISEWLLYQSFFFNIEKGFALSNVLSICGVAILAIVGAIALAAFVKYIGIAFLGKARSEKAENAKEVSKFMILGKAILAIFCIVIGIFPLPFMNLINPLIISLTGYPIQDQLSGFSSFLFLPLTMGKNVVGGFSVLIVFSIIGILTFNLVYFFNKNKISRTINTWDCGYLGLKSNMQYSGMGFSNPFKIIFKFLFKPSKVISWDKQKSQYHQTKLTYKITDLQIFDKYIYDPVIKMSTRFSKRVKYTIQAGSINLYLSYIFVVLFALLIYLKLN